MTELEMDKVQWEQTFVFAISTKSKAYYILIYFLDYVVGYQS